MTKGVKPPKRRAASTPRNPIKQLAESGLVQSGYEEKVQKNPLVQMRRGTSTDQPHEHRPYADTPKRPYSAVMDPQLRPGNRGAPIARLNFFCEPNMFVFCLLYCYVFFVFLHWTELHILLSHGMVWDSRCELSATANIFLQKQYSLVFVLFYDYDCVIYVS